MPRKVLIFAWLVFGLCSAARAAECKYAVTERIMLRPTMRDVGAASAQLLIDTRLTARIRDEMWGHGDWSFALDPRSELYKDFSAFPPCNAKLQGVDRAGKVFAERVLDHPLAKLEALGGADNNILLLTVDYSTGMGSYAGLTTIPLQLSSQGFQDTDALNPGTQQREPIRLVKSLKSDWRFSKGTKEVEILSLWCRPEPDGSSFNLIFTRYTFDGKQWFVHKRQEKGFWESDQPFPQQSAFP